jgi:hypothetical protein
MQLRLQPQQPREAEVDRRLGLGRACSTGANPDGTG